MSKTDETENDPELAAMGSVYTILKKLDRETQIRVIEYVSGRLKLKTRESVDEPINENGDVSAGNSEFQHDAKTDASEDLQDELQGISPVAVKWMRRNRLTAVQLGRVFSLGVDEIDLVAQTMPGKNKKEQMRSVLLLKGVAAFLSSGTPKFSDEVAREACNHYGVYDAKIYSRYFKALSAEINSSYALTNRGLANAVELLRGML